MVDSAYWSPILFYSYPVTRLRNSWVTSNPIFNINEEPPDFETYVQAWRKEIGDHDMGTYGDSEDEWYQMDWYGKFFDTGGYDRIVSIMIRCATERDAGDDSCYRTVFLSSDDLTRTSSTKFYESISHTPPAGYNAYFEDQYDVPNTTTVNSLCDLDVAAGEFSVRLYCPVIEGFILHDDNIMFKYVQLVIGYVPQGQLWSSLYGYASCTFDGKLSYIVQRAANSNEKYWISYWKTYISDNGSGGTYVPLQASTYKGTITADHTGYDTNKYWVKCLVKNAEGTAWGTLAGATAYDINTTKPTVNTDSSLNDSTQIATITWDSQAYDKANDDIVYWVYYKKWQPGESVPSTWEASAKSYDVGGGDDDHPATRSVTTDTWITIDNDYLYLFKSNVKLVSYESYDSDLTMVYYLQDAPVIPDVDTTDTSSGIDNVEDDYVIDLAWTATDDASYGANASVHPVTYTGMSVYYHATDSTPDIILSESQYTTDFNNGGIDSDACTLTVQANGYYGVVLHYDQEYEVSYEGQYYTNGDTTIDSTIKYFRVAKGWQGIINSKTNPIIIGGKPFLNIGGTVGGSDDRDLNPEGNEEF